METLFEPLIERFLTLDGNVFVSPQYAIKDNKETDDGGSCPDFLALDFKHSELVVVEVNGGSDIKGLAERVDNRETRWFAPIRRRFIDTGRVGPNWKIRFLGFVRERHPNNVSKLEAKFKDASDVAFYPIEQAILAYEYWDKRIAMGLPRSKSEQHKG